MQDEEQDAVRVFVAGRSCHWLALHAALPLAWLLFVPPLAVSSTTPPLVRLPPLLQLILEAAAEGVLHDWLQRINAAVAQLPRRCAEWPCD